MLVTEWYFQGDPEKRYFGTKLETETEARKAFPDESPDRRYDRILFRETWRNE